MKRSVEEHASRFDERASEYDGSKGPEYREAVSLVVDHASPEPTETVLDIGTGTGTIAFGLAEDAAQVVGRDISEGMLSKAREKAADRNVDNVSFGEGRFREPNAPEEVDIVTSNYALHHLDDAEKRNAIESIAALEPKRFVLGDVMLFEFQDEPHYSPEHDDPATVGMLVDAFTDAGFVVTAVEQVHEQIGVLVGERRERD